MHGIISESAALLALATLNYADDNGRFRVQFKPMQALLFTYRTLSVPIERAFKELEECHWLFTYKSVVEGREETFAQITNFNVHQRINRPQKSQIPAPPKPQKKPSEMNAQCSLTDDSLNDHGIVNEHSLSSEMNAQCSLTDDSLGKGKEGKGKEGRESTRTDAEIPSIDEVKTWADMSAVEPDYAAAKWADTNEKHGWIVNSRLIDWRQRWLRFWIADREKWYAKKSGAGPSQSPVSREISLKTRKLALEQLIRDHPANPESGAYDENCSVETRKELTAYRCEVEGITRQLATGGAK